MNASRGRTWFGWSSYRVKCVVVKNPSYPRSREMSSGNASQSCSRGMPSERADGNQEWIMYCESGSLGLTSSIPLSSLGVLWSSHLYLWVLVYPDLCGVCCRRVFRYNEQNGI